ncbi:MAG TPA: VOC family protein [Rhizomicrobium sp.]|jgi:catechol 2,3-dioxygenase-like lactoylglutathione lyase family enzyme
MAIRKACPLLPSADLGRAVGYYVDKLGFSKLALSDGHAIVERDGAEIHFWPCTDRHVIENSGAYIRVDEIQAVHDSMLGAADGGRITEPQDREWGMREFYVVDLDGNLLRFGQPVGAR